jgi:hypothetical protein
MVGNSRLTITQNFTKTTYFSASTSFGEIAANNHINSIINTRQDLQNSQDSSTASHFSILRGIYYVLNVSLNLLLTVMITTASHMPLCLKWYENNQSIVMNIHQFACILDIDFN